MAACSVLADGTLVRWHYPDFSECEAERCQRRHATKAELDDFAEEARA